MTSGAKRKAKESIKLKQFDILSDELAVSDHHFVKERTPSDLKNPASSVSKAIAKEWKILEECLPESIYVRAYEQRVDLLRAVIIGALQTPYHDGVFFFDILLPPNYPSHPPKLHYHSHGYRINPNLYANGYVCLSLLNTWSGNGVEKWDPERSTILQVLVSIQGLVLNSQPYFNEPAYNSLLLNNAYAKVSLDYNKEVFVMSCKTLLNKLGKPPNAFEEVVLEHCRQRGVYLLDAINSYRNGCTVIGEYLQDGTSSSSSSSQISADYKSTLEKTHKDLIDAFKKYHVMPFKKIQPPKLENVKASNGKGGAKKRKTEVESLRDDVKASKGKGGAKKRKTEVESLLEDAKAFNGTEGGAFSGTKGAAKKMKTEVESLLENVKASKGKGAAKKKKTEVESLLENVKASKGKGAVKKKKTEVESLLENVKAPNDKGGAKKRKTGVESLREDVKASKGKGGAKKRKTEAESLLEDAKAFNDTKGGAKKKKPDVEGFLEDAKAFNGTKGGAKKMKTEVESLLENVKASKGKGAAKKKTEVESLLGNVKASKGTGATKKKTDVESLLENVKAFNGTKGGTKKKKTEVESLLENAKDFNGTKGGAKKNKTEVESLLEDANASKDKDGVKKRKTEVDKLLEDAKTFNGKGAAKKRKAEVDKLLDDVKYFNGKSAKKKVKDYNTKG